MDTSKFRVLWEYAIPAKTRATSEDLFRLCMMFLPDSALLAEESKQEIQNQCLATLQQAPENFTNKALLDICLADEAFTSLLAAKAQQQEAARPTKPAGGALRSILDDVDENEEDSSVGSQSSSEDEEEEEEEEEEIRKPKVFTPAPPAPVPVVMKGFIKKNGPKVEWSGNWALTNEAFEAGDKAKFRFECSADGFEFTSADNKQLNAAPKHTTIWEGSFLIKDATAKEGFTRVDEKNIAIDFALQPAGKSKWQIMGKGANVNGTFTLEGELDGTTRRMAMLKHITFYAVDKKKKKRSKHAASSSEDEVEEGEDELDPTELADLERDQREQNMVTKKQRRS